MYAGVPDHSRHRWSRLGLTQVKSFSGLPTAHPKPDPSGDQSACLDLKYPPNFMGFLFLMARDDDVGAKVDAKRRIVWEMSSGCKDPMHQEGGSLRLLLRPPRKIGDRLQHLKRRPRIPFENRLLFSTPPQVTNWKKISAFCQKHEMCSKGAWFEISTMSSHQIKVQTVPQHRFFENITKKAILLESPPRSQCGGWQSGCMEGFPSIFVAQPQFFLNSKLPPPQSGCSP